MAKVPKTSSSSASRWPLTLGALRGAAGLLLLASACLPPVPDTPPKPSKLAILVCADSDHEIFDELKAKFSRFDVSKIAETP